MLFQYVRPRPPLDAYIDSIFVQEDFSPVNFANRNPVKVLPSTLAVIGIQYGSPMKVVENGKEIPIGTSGITGLQSAFKAYRSTGGTGTIIVRFKAGGLSAFTRYPIHHFRDANIGLDLVFAPGLVAEMEERVGEAANAAERVAAVERFLMSVWMRTDGDPLSLHAASLIERRNGDVSVKRLAGELYVSGRTLERKFNELIGIAPKKFANIVRFQQAVRLRNAGRDYLDIVHACNFSDHAHFAHDFKAFTGHSPEQFFRSASQPELVRHFNGGKAGSDAAQTMYH